MLKGGLGYSAIWFFPVSGRRKGRCVRFLFLFRGYYMFCVLVLIGRARISQSRPRPFFSSVS